MTSFCCIHHICCSLQLLRGIDRLKIKNVDPVELRSGINAMADKFGLNYSKPQAARRDHVSHFILRLAYCRTEDLRRWFLQQECQLFKHRLEGATAAQFKAFMLKEGLAFDTASEAEIQALSDKLSAVDDNQKNTNRTDLTSKQYFKYVCILIIRLIRML